jgi:hypothetical protein
MDKADNKIQSDITLKRLDEYRLERWTDDNGHREFDCLMIDAVTANREDNIRIKVRIDEILDLAKGIRDDYEQDKKRYPSYSYQLKTAMWAFASRVFIVFGILFMMFYTILEATGWDAVVSGLMP